jgi:hypothetical protein
MLAVAYRVRSVDHEEWDKRSKGLAWLQPTFNYSS